MNEQHEEETTVDIFAVYKKDTVVKDEWTMVFPLFAKETDANSRKSDLTEISVAHGLMVEYKVEPLELEGDYSAIRELLYNDIERKEVLGIE